MSNILLPSSNSSKDRFGYYTVGDFKTYSKVEAIELAELYKKFPIWHFNDVEFSAYNWKIEPKESLAELYRRRAQQIREKYDHIVIFYSGGADSGNVVNSFVDNNIPFEEIATYNYWSLDPRQDTYFHSEQVKVSYPRIKELQDQGVKFKHRPIDLSEIAHDIFKDTFWDTHRAYFGNGHWGTTHIAKTYIREKIKDYQTLIEKGVKIGFIWGSEKPRVEYNQMSKKYAFKFIDAIDNGPGTRHQIVNREWEHDEMFYCSPDCIDLLCKQGHVIMNFFKKHKDFPIDQMHSDNKIDLPDIKLMFDNHLTEDGMSFRNLLNWLIYPKFDFKMFTVGKPHSSVYSLRDEMWLKDHTFKQQIDKLGMHFHSISRKWWRTEDNLEHGLKFFYSKPYYLE
jgi:hypothetical protein